MEEAEHFKHNGFTVRIYFDPDPMSPRENDNLVTLHCSHGRYKLGDEQHTEPMTAKDVIKMVRNSGDKVLAMLPLYLYDHSGITMNTTGFACRWDSGQVGWGYITKSSAEAMGCVGSHEYQGETTTWDKARYLDAIRGEVAEYDNFLTGQCFGYVIEDEDGDELDSCWGFIGDVDYVRTEAKSAAEHAHRKGQVSSGCTATCAG